MKTCLFHASWIHVPCPLLILLQVSLPLNENLGISPPSPPLQTYVNGATNEKVLASHIVAHHHVKQCYQGRTLRAVLLSGVACFQRECFFPLCHVEEHMLMNEGRREAIKGKLAALGGRSGAAVQFFLTKSLPPAPWRGCFPADCRHSRKRKGYHCPVFLWLLHCPFYFLFGALIHLTYLPEIKNSHPVTENYRTRQIMFVTGINLCMRKE